MGVAVGCGSGDREVVFVEVVSEKSRVIAFAVTRRIQRIVERVERVSRLAIRLGGLAALVSLGVFLVYGVISKEGAPLWLKGFSIASFLVIYTVPSMYYTRRFVFELIYRLYFDQNPGIMRYLLSNAPLVFLYILLLWMYIYKMELDMVFILASIVAIYEYIRTWAAKNMTEIKRIWGEERAAILQCPEEELKKLVDNYQCVGKSKPRRLRLPFGRRKTRIKFVRCQVVFP